MNYFIGDKAFAAPSLEAGLYLVATPIGNLRDITLRALETLAGVDTVYCEDTRVTARLLDRYGIRRPLKACHEHSEQALAPAIVAEVQLGKAVALVSDAGTPLISDPGFRLVDAAAAAGIRVFSIPGASSVLTALLVSGLVAQPFLFHGFLPQKHGERLAQLRDYATSPATLVFFESPNRLLASLVDIAEVFADRKIAVARELTKIHEECLRGTATEVHGVFAARDSIKGECVLVISGTTTTDVLNDDAVARIVAAAASSFAPSKAAAQIAKLTGLSREDAFARVLALKHKNG